MVYKLSIGSINLIPEIRLPLHDGVTEATNSSLELFGMEQLEASLNNVRSSSPSEILAAVKRDIDSFVGDAPQFDDITMLSLEYMPR